MPDGHVVRPGLRVPPIFYGLDQLPDAGRDLHALIANAGDVTDPRTPWFAADNLLTYGHTVGFLAEPRFVNAVLAAGPQRAELALAWRTHTLCWAADSSRAVEGEYVECGTYEGYSMSVVLHYLGGLPERTFWFYDVFDPQMEPGVGKRLENHSPGLYRRVCDRFAPWPNVTVTRGKVPDILRELAPARIAFLHVDLNNMEAELGALEVLFDRVSPGGMIIFDDYGWSGYRAQKAAEDAFMQARGLTVLELPTGQGMAIKR
jgi:hypothetical protein